MDNLYLVIISLVVMLIGFIVANVMLSINNQKLLEKNFNLKLRLNSLYGMKYTFNAGDRVRPKKYDLAKSHSICHESWKKMQEHGIVVIRSEYDDEHGDYHVFVPNTDNYVELSKKLSDESIVVNRLSNVSTLASALAYPNGVQIKGSEYRYTLTPFVSPCYKPDKEPTIAYKAMVELYNIAGESYSRWFVANGDTPKKFEEAIKEIILPQYPGASMTVHWDTYEPLGIDIVSGYVHTISY